LIRLHLAPFLPERLLDLEDNQILETLNLEQNLMGPECGMALAYLLHTNQSLKEVYAGYNMIPDEYGVRIANSISNNKNIRLLDVSANDLGVESCRAFSNLLSGGRAISSSLENLNLAQNYLQDDGCLFLASALTTNTTLKSLTLAETRLKSHAVCAALATALTENATLERLNLPDNRVRDEGCILLAGALRVNTSLKALNLFANHIGDTGAVAMAQALQENSTLEQLNLASNHGMGHPSYKALETMLETNVVLQHLWMPTILPGSTIPMFLRINKLGRKRLLQEMDNAELWCDAIKACADDIHCLYYLVRTNPTVVSWL
jgi:Ran GTPase-activating protein (RanGAP) involved in mRNA processing and transport